MKKSVLNKQDTERIESKFECIRRNSEYQNDYKHQQEYKKQHRNYEELEKHFYPKWFHFPLLNPATAIEDYKQKKNYLYWLEETLGGLIMSDYLAPQGIKIESPEIRKYLSWKKKGYKTLVLPKEGKVTKIPFPKRNEIYDKLDAEKVKCELRRLKLSLDLKGVTKSEIKQHIEQLLEKLTPLVEKFLDKDSIHIRPTYVMDYLKRFDEAKKAKQWKEITDNQHQKRKYQKQNRIAKILINKGGWHNI